MPVEAQYSAFNRPMQEAVDYIGSLKPEFKAWAADRSGIAHSKSFMVAGITRTDALQDIHDITRAAIAKGQSLGAFKRDFIAQAQSKGWDIRGEQKDSKYLGWRAELIYNNNLRAAHMAGKWQQFEAGDVPYLRYSAIMDGRTRPLHRDWHGTIRPRKDVFWLTHYPPCGYNCRCTVTAVFDFDLKDNNWQVESKPFQTQYRDVISRATGEITDRVPVGIDAGFDHNVGMSWVSPEQALGRKLAALPKPLQGLMVDKTLSPVFLETVSTNFKRWFDAVQAAGITRGALQTVGFLDSATIQSLQTIESTQGLQLNNSSVVVIDKRTNHLSGTHKQNNPAHAWTPAMIADLPKHFADYKAILWDNESAALIVISATKHGDRLAYIAIGSSSKKLLDFSKPQVLSLGARPASEFLTKFKNSAGQTTNTYTVLVGAI
jgi:SPP1 gp7 family putative phage head morphogenesis protein